MKKITSRDNPIIKSAARLKQKKYRSRENLFLLEGKKLVQEALNLLCEVNTLFIDMHRMGEYEDITNQGGCRDCYQVSSEVMAVLSDTETPQGIVAVLPVPDYDLQALSRKAGSMVYLDRLSDPGNLGTIIRTGWAFGAAAILLSPDCVDPYNPKVVRASMGGVLSIPILENITVQHLMDLKKRGFEVLCTTLQAAHSIYDKDLAGKKVFVIGNESQGVSQEVLETADISLKIPMRPGIDSLNAAVACGIILSEVWRKRLN